jgi:hypothetical protein
MEVCVSFGGVTGAESAWDGTPPGTVLRYPKVAGESHPDRATDGQLLGLASGAFRDAGSGLLGPLPGGPHRNSLAGEP